MRLSAAPESGGSHVVDSDAMPDGKAPVTAFLPRTFLAGDTGDDCVSALSDP